jgi:hypothetical protein
MKTPVQFAEAEQKRKIKLPGTPSGARQEKIKLR